MLNTAIRQGLVLMRPRMSPKVARFLGPVGNLALSILWGTSGVSAAIQASRDGRTDDRWHHGVSAVLQLAAGVACLIAGMRALKRLQRTLPINKS
jgi:hypothetical protein